MGLTIHWSFQGPQKKSEAKSIIEKLRQRAMDLPFESVGDILHFSGNHTDFESDPDGEHRWFKIQARETIWSKDGRTGWDVVPKEIIGFQIIVAPGSEPMEIFLAVYPKSILIQDERTRKPKRLRTNRSGWSGGGFTKTQYASDVRCGGIPNFLRAHLSVCKMLDHAKELGILQSVSDEGGFFEKRDVPALVNEVGEWNAFIAAGASALDKLMGEKSVAPIKDFPDFEQLAAKGQDRIDGLLRCMKERQARNQRVEARL
jgi:hypothetical protein